MTDDIHATDPDELSDVPAEDGPIGDYGLGAVPSTDDPADARFPISLFVTAQALPDAYLSPLHPMIYRQGNTGRCVGFSGAWQRTVGEFPEQGKFLAFDAAELYCELRRRMGDHGCNQQEGSSIRIALQVLKDRGARDLASRRFMRIEAYSRLMTDADIKLAILTYGAAWVATSWHQNWFHPGVVGNRHWLGKPGAPVGAHAYGLDGWDETGWRLVNNWGTAWADGGRCWISYANFRAVLIEAWRTIDKLEKPLPPPPPKPVPEEDMPAIKTWRLGELAETKPLAELLFPSNDQHRGEAHKSPPVFDLIGEAPDGHLVIAIDTGKPLAPAFAHVRTADVVRFSRPPGADPKAIAKAGVDGFNEGLETAASVTAAIPHREVPS